MKRLFSVWARGPKAKPIPVKQAFNLSEDTEMVVEDCGGRPRFTIFSNLKPHGVSLSSSELLRAYDIASEYILPEHVGEL